LDFVIAAPSPLPLWERSHSEARSAREVRVRVNAFVDYTFPSL
jgi:hypothetical protein